MLLQILLINEAKSYGIPCIVSMDNTNIYAFKKGVKKVDISNYEEFSKKILKLFKDKKYITLSGQNAKLSLDNYNLYILKVWISLFKSLKNKGIEFQNLRNDIENKLINSSENSGTKKTKNLNITTKKQTSQRKSNIRSKTNKSKKGKKK